MIETAIAITAIMASARLSNMSMVSSGFGWLLVLDPAVAGQLLRSTGRIEERRGHFKRPRDAAGDVRGVDAVDGRDPQRLATEQGGRVHRGVGVAEVPGETGDPAVVGQLAGVSGGLHVVGRWFVSLVGIG